MGTVSGPDALRGEVGAGSAGLIAVKQRSGDRCSVNRRYDRNRLFALLSMSLKSNSSVVRFPGALLHVGPKHVSYLREAIRRSCIRVDTWLRQIRMLSEPSISSGYATITARRLV